MLVGNNKNLWRMFLEACAGDTSLLQADDPLDTYVEREVQAAAHATGCEAGTMESFVEASRVYHGSSTGLWLQGYLQHGAGHSACRKHVGCVICHRTRGWCMCPRLKGLCWMHQLGGQAAHGMQRIGD